jgi:hypothetical protein
MTPDGRHAPRPRDVRRSPGLTPVEPTRARTREQALLDLQQVVGNHAIQAMLGYPGPVREPPPGDVGASDSLRAVARKESGTGDGQRAAKRKKVVDATAAAVRDRLSYGAFDWAITDAEARESLDLLGRLRGDALDDALRQLGTRYVRRLLDNLPGDARRTSGYTKLIVALGPAGVRPYVESLLSYGVFDWVITDHEVTQVLRIVRALDTASQTTLLSRINSSGRLARLIDNANATHHRDSIQPLIRSWPKGEALSPDQKTILRVIFQSTGDGQLGTLKLCMAQRFDLQIGGATTAAAAKETAIEWEPGGLRRTYPVLEALPAAHVAANARLISLGRYVASGVGGYYWRNEAAIGYDPGRLRDRQRSDEGDPLVGVNRFDKVVRHEVGHAVDSRLGWSRGAEAAKASRGGWRSYADLAACAGAMVHDAADAISRLEAAQRTDVIAKMVKAMQDRNPSLDDLKGAIRGLDWYDDLPAATRRAVLADPSLTALRAGLRKPWYGDPNGGIHLGQHVYQESYEHDWTRYRHDARSRKVSQYQFRAPGEWFAEAYAAYYEPDRRGRGAKLADRDSDTKSYFDTTVHVLAKSR